MLNITFLIVIVGIEIGALYAWCLKNSVKVANCLDLRLKPLNKDRAFVAASLVRAALELGNNNELVYGVNPLKETNARSDLMVVVLGILYRAKIAISGFLIKVVMKRFVARGGAKYMLPWAAVPATAVWNAFVGHVIMKEAMLRGCGISTGIELFNQIVGDHNELSDLCKLQICRAIGCNITHQRDMYPTKEVLLKHAVETLGMVKSGVVRRDESGILDNTEDMIEDCEALLNTPGGEDEVQIMLDVLALVTVLDGNATRRGVAFLSEITAQFNKQDSTDPREANVHLTRFVAQNLRNQNTLDTDDISDCTADTPTQLVPEMYWVNEALYCCAKCMAC